MTTESDRELLEAAARAALMWKDAFSLDDEWNPIWEDEKGFYLGWGTGWWNPLQDDGDALRLFTRLPFRNLYVSEVGVTVSWEREDGSGHGFKCDEYASEHHGDLNAATRRAITRAAAAIGAHKEQA